jgi:hypothetical protein
MIKKAVFFYKSFERLVDTRERQTAVLGLDPGGWRDPVGLGPPYNLVTQLNAGAGLELLCPAEAHDEDWFGVPILAERGEGLGLLVFAVDDVDATMERAARLGFPERSAGDPSALTTGALPVVVLATGPSAGPA